MENQGDSTSQGNRTARLANQFRKTRKCIFWERGRCTRGADCAYAHGDAELRGQPDLRMTSVCKRIVDYGHCEVPNCSFAHSLEELRATSKFFKTTICKFHAVRECRLGAFCRHAHGKEELREDVRETAQAYSQDLSSGGLCSTSTSSAPSAPARPPPPRLYGGMNSFSGCAPSMVEPAGYIGASAVPVAPPMPPPTQLASLREEHYYMEDFGGASMPAITPGLAFASCGSTGVEPYPDGQLSSGVGRQRISQEDEVFLLDQPGMMILRL